MPRWRPRTGPRCGPGPSSRFLTRGEGIGTWQGIYIWEHRRQAHYRELVVHIAGI
ncbi:hypothetical protein [Moorena sp. SIO2C4]|uniref:hypothetical protein n=1 Tax=Moorena sp. SIO2C4 TaxID=2607824 RepID=UPI00257B0143|nr:hypothetical protein [Moorena sp. SIO2C4]